MTERDRGGQSHNLPNSEGQGTRFLHYTTDIARLTDAELELAPRLIQAASEAYAHPVQSNFYVRAAGITAEGKIVKGGNQEHALSDAYVHGETSVISNIRAQYGEIPVTGIGFYRLDKDLGHGHASPCGACRDVLIAETDPNLLMLVGNDQEIFATRLHKFMKESFETYDPDEVSVREWIEADIALYQGVSEYLPEEQKKHVYGVALIGEDGSAFRGSHYTNAAYDAVPPGLAAVQTYRNSVKLTGLLDSDFMDPEIPDLKRIIIAANDRLPRVLYRDRQALLELDEVIRLKHNRTEPIEVILVNIDPEIDTVVEAVRTNTEEWMPYAFSAGSFGMEDAIRSQYDKLK